MPDKKANKKRKFSKLPPLPKTKKETQVTIRCSWETRALWGTYVAANARTIKDAEQALRQLLDLQAAKVKFI